MNNSGHDIYSNINKKIKKNKKEHLKKIEKYLYYVKLRDGERPIPYNKVQAIFDCCGILNIGYYPNLDTKIINSNRCKNWKLCHRCAIIRQNEHRSKIIDYINRNWHVNYKNWYYIVLPIKHDTSQGSEELFLLIKKYMKIITQRIRNGRKGLTNSRLFDKIQGGLYTIEVTHSQNGWNWHVNIMFYTEKPLEIETEKKKLSQIWQVITEDSYIIYITAVNSENFRNSVMELVKYCVKFHGLSPSQMIEIVQHTERRRFIGYLGDCRSFKYFKPSNFVKPEAEIRLLYDRKLQEWQKKIKIDLTLN